MWDWQDLGTAIALMLVLEGVMPFANPTGLRKTLLRLTQTDDFTLRMTGLFSMLGGVFLLYLVH